MLQNQREQEEENPVRYDSPWYDDADQVKNGLETGVDCGEICQDLELGGLCSDHSLA